MPKVKETHEVVEYDGTTGEVVSHRRNTVTAWESEPPYVKLYLDTVLYLKDLPKGYSGILYQLLRRMHYAGDADGHCIVINAAVKRRIGDELGVSTSRIDNVLSDLVKGDLLKRLDRGLYQVNPYLFGYGEWQDIAKLRLTVTFDAKGKTIMGEIERKKASKSDPLPGQEVLKDAV